MSINQPNLTPGPSRSTFITVMAWIFIAGAGFSTFIALLQALMFAFVFPANALSPAELGDGPEGMPALVRFMIQNIKWIFVMFWSLSALTLIAAIGLLKRKNWARLVFVGLMAFGIIWNLGGIAIQAQMMSSIPKPPPGMPNEADVNFETMLTIMKFATALFAIGVSLLLGWIIKRLLSTSVKAEFTVL